MLFHIFCSQEERRRFGGSAFIEMQFCELPVGTRKNELVAVRNINHWKNDSLYIYLDDIDTFYREYSLIFDCGIYCNLEIGIVDIYGINYYASALIDLLIEKLSKGKPIDYECLISWLNESKKHNGFYILGI